MLSATVAASCGGGGGHVAGLAAACRLGGRHVARWAAACRLRLTAAAASSGV